MRSFQITSVASRIEADERSKFNLGRQGKVTIDDERDNVRLTDRNKGNPNKVIISESGIYESIFGSDKPEAKEFKRWVKRTLKHLRQSSGLEGFQIFRMMDKEQQKDICIVNALGEDRVRYGEFMLIELEQMEIPF